jgi:hypothetical protein
MLASITVAVAQLAAAPLPAEDDLAEVSISQPVSDTLPRPTVGVAAAGGPTLAFFLSLEYRCPVGSNQRNLFLSIADTMQAIDIPAGQPSPVTVRVEVAMQQLPWLQRPDLACARVDRRPDETGSGDIAYYRLRAEASGYVMLTCRNDANRESLAEATTPLDVWLSCPVVAEPAATP